MLLNGRRGDTLAVMQQMGHVAIDVLMDAGVLIEALPIWLEDWEHPEGYSNPYLIRNIRHEGVPLWT